MVLAFHGFSWRSASFLRSFLSQAVLPLSVKIVVDFGTVIAVHGSRGIVKSRQQVGLDIPHFGRVIIQTVKHVLHMGEIYFQETAFYHFAGVVISGNADVWAFREDGLQHQFNQFVHTLIPLPVDKSLKFNIFFDNLPIGIYPIYPIPIHLCTVRRFPSGIRID